MATPALSLIRQIAQARARLNAEPKRRNALERLQRLQVDRLRATYADFYAEDRYQAALDFFLNDLYGPHDFRARDHDLERVMQSWHRLLPSRGLEAITNALELEALSQSLDLDVLDQLGDASLTETTYASAYRAANRRRDRERQISLILQAGHELDELIHHKWVPTMLRMARRPARLAGVTALHDFLERGYAAFAKMGIADTLLNVIETRETAILRNLFAGTAQPFNAVGHRRIRRKA